MIGVGDVVVCIRSFGPHHRTPATIAAGLHPCMYPQKGKYYRVTDIWEKPADHLFEVLFGPPVLMLMLQGDNTAYFAAEFFRKVDKGDTLESMITKLKAPNPTVSPRELEDA